MIEAILYIEFTANAISTRDNMEKLRTTSLSNCKQLVYDIPFSGFIIHLACNDAESLNEAISRDFAGIEGVSEVTTLMIRKR